MSRVLPLSLLLLAALGTGSLPAQDLDFAHDIVPILRQQCGKCHTGDKREGAFSMNTRALLLAGGEGGKAVIAGKSAESALIKRITSMDADVQMPPEGPRLSAEQVAKLKKWVDAGVLWEAGFVFHGAAYEPPLKPRDVALPPAIDNRTNPVDRIVDAYFTKHKIDRPAIAADPVFLRRVYLDLVGLLPTPEQQEKFLADKRPDKRLHLVRELLADDVAYADHWLTFWNDLLRNDYTGTGFITGGRKQITKWLYASLVDNKPYDQFVRELIAPSGDSEGFIQGIRWRGDVNSSQTTEVQFAQSISQAFLGINMKCASCHDSFIDRWKLDEAYGLAAIFSQRPLEIHRCDKPTGKMAQAAWIFPELGQIDPTAAQKDRLQQLAGLMTHPENGRLTRTIVNRLWHRMLGRGVIHPTDAMHTEPWNADLLDFLAADFAAHQYNLKHTLELICTSEAYQAATPTIEKPADATGYKFRGPAARRMTAEQLVDAVWQITGAGPTKPDAAVVRKEANRLVRASLVKSDYLMRSLGRPNRDQIVSMRPSDLTTLEAIDLANGQSLADTLERGSQKILEKNWASPDELVQWLYRSALCRAASPDELAVARGLLGDKPQPATMADLLWAVLMLPEFQLVR